MIAWGATDRGMVRVQNQDAFALDIDRKGERPPRPVALIVCDGMGGANAGNVASAIAVKAVNDTLSGLLKPHMNARQMSSALEEAAVAANVAVCDHARQNSECRGMGTTMVAAIAAEGLAVVANVGDSRAYKLNQDGITLVTRDHSIVNDLMEKGELTAAQARSHPRKNWITRALGTDDTVQCDLFEIKLEAGEFLMLCSDGLTNMLSDQELLYEIIHGGDHAGVCNRLIAAANERGGQDNITVVLLSM
ncbi:protein phosphatase PrpC [Clostridia bacterium]|nr:protein phosphatase PrpC [Clostridia bacterium]